MAFSKAWTVTSFFVYGLQRWWCYFHGDSTRKPASRAASGVISILHLCTPLKCAHCVFIVPRYAALYFHYRKNSHEADRLTTVLEELPSQLFVQLMIKREKKQYLCCRPIRWTKVMISLQRILAVLLQALPSIWCSARKQQSKNEVSLKEAYYICCYQPWQEDALQHSLSIGLP